MEKKVIVISLGGSLIVPKEGINNLFLEKFKQIITGNQHKYKFVIVCGGGSVSRKYISSLKEAGKSVYLQSLIGISITRTNARFMSYFFGINPEKGIPHDMKQVKNLLLRNNVIFCGSLRYAPKQTSDSTAAKLASYLKCDFVNLTNVDGLYTSNPFENKNSKFVPEINAKELYERANRMKYLPGQHFVIDQEASKLILKNKIRTFILGQNLTNFENLLKGRKFKGTIVEV